MPDIIEPTLKLNIIEVEGRTYIPVDQMAIAPWSCVIGKHPISTLTLKDYDLLLISNFLL